MVTTDGHSARRLACSRTRSRTGGLLGGRRRIAGALALGFGLTAALIAMLLGGAAGPNEEIVRSDEGRLFVLSLQTLASRRDAAGIQDVCTSAESVLSGGPTTYARDWQLLSPVCVRAQTAQTPVEWTELQLELRRLAPL